LKVEQWKTVEVYDCKNDPAPGLDFWATKDWNAHSRHLGPEGTSRISLNEHWATHGLKMSQKLGHLAES